jgi:AraC-like DNA-binding protein
MSAANALPLIEAALRGGAVTLLAVLALLLLRGRRRTSAGIYGALFAVSIAAYVIVTAPGLLNARLLGLLPLRLLSLGSPAMFWLFAKAAFDDDFVRSWRDAPPWLATVAIGFTCARFQLSGTCILYHGIQLVFVALAIREAVTGSTGDLIEERRRFRVVLVLSSAIFIAAVIVLEIFMDGPPAAAPLSIVNAAGVLALTGAFVAAQLSPARSPSAATRPIPLAEAAPSTAPPADPQEQALLERLRRLMEVDKIYREEGLGVATLAEKLALPEYRLRRLINQRLGHRNFSSFVNGYRLADAMAALADRSQVEVPIVTIALDAGFQSLGPFNRAFKAQTGMTPTDYRRRQLEGGRGTAPILADSGIGQPS